MSEEWQVQQRAQLRARVWQERKDLFHEIVARIIFGGICAAIAYSCRPGDIFDKGLATLTLDDLISLFFSGMFAVGALRIFFGERRAS